MVSEGNMGEQEEADIHARQYAAGLAAAAEDAVTDGENDVPSDVVVRMGCFLPRTH